MGLDFTGISLPFSPADLLSSGNALLGVVGGFVLLGLAFLMVPKLVSLIVGAFKSAAAKSR